MVTTFVPGGHTAGLAQHIAGTISLYLDDAVLHTRWKGSSMLAVLGTIAEHCPAWRSMLASMSPDVFDRHHSPLPRRQDGCTLTVPFLRVKAVNASELCGSGNLPLADVCSSGNSALSASSARLDGCTGQKAEG